MIAAEGSVDVGAEQEATVEACSGICALSTSAHSMRRDNAHQVCLLSCAIGKRVSGQPVLRQEASSLLRHAVTLPSTY